MATPNTLKRNFDREIFERHRNGETQESLAAAFGCNHRTIGRRLRRIAEERGTPCDLDNLPPSASPSLEQALREFADWIGSPEEEAARSRPRRGDIYECESDLTPGGEGYIDGTVL